MSHHGSPRLGPTRAEVLDHLRSLAGPAAVGDVSSALGLHPNTTRFHLDALTEAGLVIRETEHRERPGRPRVLFRAVAAAHTNGYADLAGAMVRHFASTVESRGEHAIAAGETWGAELREADDPGREPLDRLVTSLRGLGYAPELAPGPDTVLELHSCPYLDLAGHDPEVVCKLHLGLVRGLLGPDQPWAVSAIQPFARPGTCLVRLEAAPDTAAPSALAAASAEPRPADA